MVTEIISISVSVAAAEGTRQLLQTQGLDKTARLAQQDLQLLGRQRSAKQITLHLVATVVGQVTGQSHACIDVQGAISVKRCHHGDGDGAEGIDAFIGKRKAEWKGR